MFRERKGGRYDWSNGGEWEEMRARRRQGQIMQDFVNREEDSDFCSELGERHRGFLSRETGPA